LGQFVVTDNGRIELESDITLQFRLAEEVDSELARAVQRVCEQCRQVSACYLLDARRPDTGEMALIIALTVDDEAQDMDVAAHQVQTILRQFPAQAPKTFIMSSASFVESYAGAEFYSREAD
jgi:hypothetical protein